MISTGIEYLDRLTGGLRPGDNVVWQTSDGVPVDHFIRSFHAAAGASARRVIFVSFNFSPQTILRRHDYLFRDGNAVLVDAFTHGKGNGDSVFLDFYRTPAAGAVKCRCVENPRNITSFVTTMNEIESDNTTGAFYIFDGLTGMHELWKNEAALLDYFSFTCPKLYDLNTLAYWIMSREAHSAEFIAGIMHITQIVFSIRTTDSENCEFRIHKLQDRTARYGARPSYFKVIDREVYFDDARTADQFDIGGKVKKLRKDARMTQADLASLLAMTPGAISQIENGVITPSLHTLVQIASVFARPVDFFIGGDGHQRSYRGFAIARSGASVAGVPRYVDMRRMLEADREDIGPYRVSLEAGAAVEGPLVLHKKKEFIAVARGALSVTVDGGDVDLGEGDGLLADDSVITGWRNRGDDACEFFYLLF